MAHLLTGLQVSLVGLTVVFGALVLIACVLGLLNRLTDAPTPPAPARHAHNPDEISEELIVVLAAAAQAILGQQVLIHHVRYGKAQTEHAWSEQGRLTLMASHITRS